MTEDSRNKMEDNQALLEEMLSKAQIAPEPGTMEKVINDGAGENALPPMVSNSLKSAGYVYIWDNRTGERSVTNRNMLPMQLRKKRPDGSVVFTTIDPHIKPLRGTYKCMLHPDDPNRKHYDELGLATCRKATLTSPYQVKRHMQKRHKVEYETIEEERKEKERQEDRAFQRKVMGVATNEELPSRGGRRLYL
jgi:hypothetical protein